MLCLMHPGCSLPGHTADNQNSTVRTFQVGKEMSAQAMAHICVGAIREKALKLTHCALVYKD